MNLYFIRPDLTPCLAGTCSCCAPLDIPDPTNEIMQGNVTKLDSEMPCAQIFANLSISNGKGTSEPASIDESEFRLTWTEEGPLGISTINGFSFYSVPFQESPAPKRTKKLPKVYGPPKHKRW